MKLLKPFALLLVAWPLAAHPVPPCPRPPGLFLSVRPGRHFRPLPPPVPHGWRHHRRGHHRGPCR